MSELLKMFVNVILVVHKMHTPGGLSRYRICLVT